MPALRNTFIDRAKQAGKALTASGAAIALLATPFSTATANDDAPQVTQVAATDASSNSPINQAHRFSQENDAVGVLVYGSADGMSGSQIGDFLASRFADEGLNARVFTMPTASGRDGVAITFFFDGGAYGPSSGEDWGQKFEEVVLHARADGSPQLAQLSYARD